MVEKKRVVLQSIVLVLIATGPAVAREDGAGTTTADFLKVGTQAQALAQAEAVTALADGISFVSYNPASVQMKSMTLTATHALLYEGVSLEEIALGIPFGPKAGLVIRGNGIVFDRTERTDQNGNRLGTYGSTSFAAGAGFYGHVGPLSLGMFGKTIRQKIDAHESSAAAADFGVRYLTPLPGLSLGASLLNVGRPATFIAQQDELPRAARAGIGYHLGFLKLGADAVQYRGQPVQAAAGAELTLFSGLKLRAGYRTKTPLTSPYNAGIGFRFSALDLSYAYNPGDVFGAAHRLTVTVR